MCCRLLGQRQSAEDAFQATFLVLARRARTIRKPGSLACWLHGVAYRVARKARAYSSPVQACEEQLTSPATADPAHQAVWRELGWIIEEEVNGLAEKYRTPILLCYWEKGDCPLADRGTVPFFGCRTKRSPGTLDGRLAQ